MKCVYIIINLINGKKYIGSTNNFSRRKGEHLWMLTNNKHKNPHLQAAINKYNIENFVFNILEKVENTSELYIREQFYLDKYKTYDKSIGYNICKNAATPNTEKNKKQVTQYDFEGNKIKTFNSLAEVARNLNCNYSAISNAAKGKSKSSQNYIWIFDFEYSIELLNNKLETIKYKDSLEKKLELAKNPKKINKSKFKPVLLYDINNNLIAEYESVLEASRQTNCSTESISGFCTGKYKRNFKNMKWKYKEK